MDKVQGITNVIVVGAGGSLNPVVIASLQSLGFVVSVLVRDASAAVPPAGVTCHRTDYSNMSLVKAFKAQDAVVNTITMADSSEQKNIIDAAVEAGVKRFLPAEFGIDTAIQSTVEIVPFLRVKPEIVEYLRSLESSITWTSIVTGPFFDWSLRNGWFSFNVPSRTAYLHKTHQDHRFSCSTLSTVANAIARCLLPENGPSTINRYIHVRSFTVNQREIMTSLEKASTEFDQREGRQPKAWDVIEVNLEDKVAESHQKLAQGDMSALGFMLSKAIYAMNSDFDATGVAMNETLGMEPAESLDEVTKRVVSEY
ncbi:uncharacterized protein N7515_007133 [Penicillium bovifimosum]|uniref:NmrA-like domain-containing protein n=1 Tax=Penicillium bovifimosum TaxID=126998 RepID=A0A9W9GXJ7_9EURO|nr:uncharacterized protein N7515_007133 [Penicillium bovifimosum]KAJ5131094.1 hypothetical protein N7515_007133 [Penicillium bovifimosum]